MAADPVQHHQHRSRSRPGLSGRLKAVDKGQRGRQRDPQKLRPYRLGPIPRLAQHFVELGFPAIGQRLVAVFPAHQGRQ
jgi:hypothetical protein